MVPGRLERILEEFSVLYDGTGGTRRLCAVAAQVTAMTGAGIMFVTDGSPRGSLGSTDRVSGLIEELQYTLGEGPCVDASIRDDVILEPDLAAPEIPRWPAFTPLAVDGGVAAVFGFPLRVGTVRLGVLDLYRDRPGSLSDGQLGDALVTADVVARMLLDMQADAPDGTVSAGLELDADFRLVVHQASGMVSIQVGESPADALIRLRAHAFRTGRPVADVADDVVARRLRFSEEMDVPRPD